MRRCFLLGLLLAFAVSRLAPQTPPASHFDGKSWWAHVKFLADDALAGRNTGSEGLRKAEAYAVEQLEKAGLKIPEKNLEELAGLDLIGKVVVYLAGSPADIPSALASNYQTAGERWKSLDAAGVAGVITIFNPASMDIPWSRISANRNEPS